MVIFPMALAGNRADYWAWAVAAGSLAGGEAVKSHFLEIHTARIFISNGT